MALKYFESNRDFSLLSFVKYITKKKKTTYSENFMRKVQYTQGASNTILKKIN